MIIIRKAAPGISEQALARFAQRARKAAGLSGQVNVVLISSRDMRALNRRFRGKDKPTDVLSFPALPAVWPGPPTRAQGSKTDATQFSGDIVISTEIALRNARLYQHAPAQELKILILHGMLHLAGYDHESDGGGMARREERLRRELGLRNGLIRRTERVAHAPSRVRRRAR
jgi:probable rRNA maturation factor